LRAFRVHVCPGAVCAGHTALFSHRIRLAVGTCDAINLIAVNLVTQGRVWLLDNKTLAQRTRHLRHVILMAIECLGTVVVRAVASHAIHTQNPHPQGLMMTGNARVGQLVNALLPGLAQLTLTCGLGLVAPVLCHLRAITRGTMDTVRPAQVTHGLTTFGVVAERLQVSHGARIAYGASWNKDQKPRERPWREGTWSTLRLT
jgi:hypothetical protein